MCTICTVHEYVHIPRRRARAHSDLRCGLCAVRSVVCSSHLTSLHSSHRIRPIVPFSPSLCTKAVQPRKSILHPSHALHMLHQPLKGLFAQGLTPLAPAKAKPLSVR